MPDDAKSSAATLLAETNEAKFVLHEPFSDAYSRSSLADYSPTAILSHPDFLKARALLVSGMMDLYGHDPAINRLLVESERLGILFLVVDQWSGYNQKDRGSWPTVNRLKAQLARFDLASPRHVDDVLARLVAADYIVLQKISNDRRVRLLQPTDCMVSHVHRTIVPFFRALDLLTSDVLRVCFFDKCNQREMVPRPAIAEIFPWATKLLPHNKILSPFFDRTCAIQILLKFIDIEATSSDSAVREKILATSAIRWGMSRTHVRNILRDAEEAGLIVRLRQDEVLHYLTPRCVAAFDRFVADAMYRGLISCQQTTREA